MNETVGTGSSSLAVPSHTPGPWAATTRQGSWDWVVYQHDNPNIEICQMFHDGTEDNDTGEANALLVAAAPDMLAALKLALPQLGTLAIGSQEAKEAAGAAIAKAEGD